MSTKDTLANQFARTHPADAAQLLERQEIDRTIHFLNALAPELATELIRLMDSFTGAQCLAMLHRTQAAAVLIRLPLDNAVLLLRRLENGTRDAVVQALPLEKRESFELMLRYPEHTAGALMNPYVLTLPVDLDVGEAQQRVRTHSEHVMYYLYVIGRDHKLVGVLNLRELLLASATAPIASIMHQDISSLPATASLESILANPAWLELHALPVVDQDGRYIGALRHKALRRIRSQAQDRQQGPNQVGVALGELYTIGLAGLVKGASSALESDERT